MPIYEYLCAGCRVTFEVMRPVSQSAESSLCPTCHETGRRVLSLFATVVKSGDAPACAMGNGEAGPACAPHGCANCVGG